MQVMEARKITKRFPGVVALKDVDIGFELGKIHCILGENGAGKSTLIKVLTGVYMPDEGAVIIDGKDPVEDPSLFDYVAYVPQELDLFGSMTVADNLFIPFEKSGITDKLLSRKKIEDLARPWLEKFHMTVEPDQLVQDISVSEQQLLQIARAVIHEKAKFIMLDEPTTSLTTTDTERLFAVVRELKQAGKGIIFISHKLEEVFALGDEITVLRNGEKVAYASIQDVDIPWVIRQMAGRDVSQDGNFIPQCEPGEVLLDVEGLSGERFENVSFQLRSGEILGMSGLVGAGRSEVMQAIFGYLPVWAGKATVNGKPWKFGDTHYSVSNGLIYLPEERKKQGILPFMGGKDNLTITLLDNLKSGPLISPGKEKGLSGEIVDAYDIKISSLDQLIMNLSGGNQQKAIIGRSMFCHPKVLVFDEPTKGIDVGTKTEIYKLMKKHAEESGVGIILISSEMEEVLKCSNRILAMYNGRIIREFSAEEADKESVLNAIMGIRQDTETDRNEE